MTTTFDVRGLICPIVTPMDRDENPDLEATGALIEFLVAHGVDAAFVGGTTGEGPLLSLTERQRLAECVVEAARGRIAVIVHTGCQNTRDSHMLTRHAAAIGASATAAITPYFFTFTDDEIAAHYRALAEAAPELPLLLYAFPGNAKNDVSPELFARLRGQAPNIAGIKYSGNSLNRVQEYIEVAGENGGVYTGDDGLFLAALMLGTRGAVSGCCGPFPELMRGLYDAFTRGDWTEARGAQSRLRHLAQTVGYGRPSYLKAALEFRGLRAGGVRAPLANLSADDRAVLQQELLALGVLDPGAARTLQE